MIYPVNIVNTQSKMMKTPRNDQLDNTEPKRVWQHFKDISSVYRESGHNEEISKMLVKKLNKLGFDVKVKGPEANKMRPDGTMEGQGQYTICATRNVDKQKKDATILQAHMDMVGISGDNNPKKPVEFNVDGDNLKANDRTLGADNGIGIATALALAEEPQFKKMPLEMIFTTDEETGMYGAESLKAEDFHGKKLINLDSENHGEIVVGCAGMDTYKQDEKVPTKTVGDSNHKKITVELSGANGGHSGEDINKGRINPIKTVLSELGNLENIKIASMSGGEKFNSIPRSVKAEILVPKENAEKVVNQLTEKLNKAKDAHAKSDPNLNISIKADEASADPETNVLEPAFQNKFLNILGKELYTGLKATYDNGDSKTSQNLGIVNLKDGMLNLAISSRSSDNDEGKALKKEVTGQLSELFGKKISPFNSSPIWQPKYNSMLTQAAVDAYKDTEKSNPIVNVCHGGLEPAVFSEKAPNLDQISIGPDIYEPHTTQEKVNIPSVGRSYTFTKNLLEKIKNNKD